jgi:hypothetical protein
MRVLLSPEYYSLWWRMHKYEAFKRGCEPYGWAVVCEMHDWF